MKRAVAFLILAFSGAIGNAAELTLREALEKADASSPDLMIAGFDYQASLGTLKARRSIFYPTLGVEGGYQKFDSTTETLSGVFGNLYGEYKFDLGGSAYFRFQAASAEADISALKQSRIQRFIKWSIETKFSKALYLQEAVKLYETALEQNKTYGQMAQKKRASGLASDADLIEFDLNEAMLRSELEAVKGDLHEAVSDLRTSAGLNAETEFSLKGSLDHFHISESLQQLKERLARDSFELKVASLESKKAEAIKAASYSGFLPELALRATYGRRGIDLPVGPEQTYSVVARWELFSGFRDVGEFQRAAAEKSRMEFQKQQLQQNLPALMETQFKKFFAIQNRVDLESQNRERSKRYLDTVMSEYRRGVKNSADLRSASTQLMETSLRDLKYRFEGIKQKEVLQSLLGESISFEVFSTEHKVN